jgi:hypothetical protein
LVRALVGAGKLGRFGPRQGRESKHIKRRAEVGFTAELGALQQWSKSEKVLRIDVGHDEVLPHRVDVRHAVENLSGCRPAGLLAATCFTNSVPPAFAQNSLCAFFNDLG